MHLLCWQRTEVGEELQRCGLCLTVVLWPDFHHHAKLDNWERSFQSVLITLAIRGAVRALTYIPIDWALPLSKVCFFYCSARLSELKSTLNADWFAVSDCTAESAVATWFYIQGKTEVARFLPFSTGAMELTYWSFVLLGYILLDWALLTPAEEGKSGVFPSNAAQTCFLWLHGWVRRLISIMSSSFREEVQCSHKVI